MTDANNTTSSSDEWVCVAFRQEVGDGEVVGKQVGGRDIAIYNVSGVFYATDNICTHALARLSDGWVDGDMIECPLHGGRFDIKTGKGMCDPIKRDLRTYAVCIIGEEIHLSLGAKTNASPAAAIGAP